MTRVWWVTSTSSLPWVDPGAFEVAPGVHRVPLPLPDDGLRAVNVYVLTTPDGLVCVDAGWSRPESKELFVSALKSLGFALQDVRRFLVTHVHRDHYTQAVDIRRDVGSRVGLGAGERPTLTLLQDLSRMKYWTSLAPEKFPADGNSWNRPGRNLQPFVSLVMMRSRT